MNVVIAGAGGFGREVHQYLLDADRGAGRIRIAGFLVDEPDAVVGLAREVGVLGRIDEVVPAEGDEVIVAVGDPRLRRSMAIRLARRGWRFHTLVHPTAWVAPTAVLGPGAVVCPFAFVGAHARVGPGAALNTYASVGHDAALGEWSVLSPYAVINGAAVLEEAVFLGTHASVQPGVRVGRASKVAAGAVVAQDVAPRSLVAGNPGKARVLFPDLE